MTYIRLTTARIWLAVSCNVALLACTTIDNQSNINPAGNAAAFGSWGIETQHISTTIKPGDNFYKYVNEGWLDTTTLPPGYALYNAPWAVQEQVIDQVRSIVNKAANSDTRPGTAEKRIADFFRSYLNNTEIDQRGMSVLRDDLNAILTINDHASVARWMANPRANSIFHLLVQPPVNMQGGYILTLAQYRVTGLGLPGQIYYKSNQHPYPEHRKAYRAYIADTLQRAGINQAEDRAERILALETRYANSMWDFARLRQADANFNLIERSELIRYAPGFPWDTYLQARGLADLKTINIGVGAIRESAALFAQIPVPDWRSFLAFHWINNHAALLPEAFGDAHFAFYEQHLRGVETRAPKSADAIDFVERYLGDDIGDLYVEQHFPPASREYIGMLAAYIRQAFRERLLETEWMDATTRNEALSKLDNIVIEVAKPQMGIDWSGLETNPQDLIGNYARWAVYQWDSQRARIGQPISRYGDWNMYPHRIGAGYHQQYNKIFVTAGALLPPFFDPHADPAVNFGAIGQTLAHEFGHALDDQGSKFDRNGVLRDWWSTASRQAYNSRTKQLVRQFRQYEPVTGSKLSADQMLGEIVGDLTGTSIAYRAYLMYLQDQPQGAAPILDGYTGPQRFFLSSAQHARTIATDDALREIAAYRSHPPAEFRVNGIVTNLDDWYLHFGSQPGDRLYLSPEKRVRLW